MNGNERNRGRKLPARSKDKAIVISVIVVVILAAAAVVAFFIGHNNKTAVPTSATAENETGDPGVTNPQTEPYTEPVTEDTVTGDDKVEEKTLLGLLKIAREPLGSTMYVWGGGWNEEDTGAGEDAMRIGVSPRWREFFLEQDENYDYEQTEYQIHDGLDCTGYVGWVVYNVMEKEDGVGAGYVFKSTETAGKYAEMGFGVYTPAAEITKHYPGDVMSMTGHAWIVIGECADGSVVLINSTPPGVVIKGTRLADGSSSEAVELAEQYMSRYCPEWYSRYPDCSASYDYIPESSSMSWNGETLSDPEGIRNMDAAGVLRMMFSEDTPET